jgi:spore cortex biosynthesis protein YabQ
MKEQQAILFIWFVGFGFSCRLIYDLLRALRCEVKHAAAMVMVEDVLFCAVACAGCYGIFLRENHGALRAYGFIGILVGAVLYDLTFGKWLLKGFKLGFKIMLVPGRWVAAKCKKWKLRRKALTNQNR